MPIMLGAPGILVKARAGLPRAPFAIGGREGGARFTAEPLFRSIGSEPGPGIAAASIWQVLTPMMPLDGDSVWDVCHALMNEGMGIEFAEPDVQQAWIIGDERDRALAAARACDAPEQQDQRYPTAPANNLWFQDDDHSEFAAARSDSEPATDPVRIAHLDTGYDPTHATLPEHVRFDLQRNFVDDKDPNDASDNSDGLLNNLGQGTGTLGILAGKAVPEVGIIGAAPFVEVVPLRVANRVVLFSNSAIARALDYVHQLCQDPSTQIHVVTMSMGGLASAAWADAVNALYDAGVFVATAAGNNFGNLPTRHIVYPARFHRVVAACGAMADHTPYADLPFTQMAGNYGPASKMRTALAACTPNVPWARLGCQTLIDWDGGGTSSATPQIAAAAALWIRRNMAAWLAYPEGWMRVEAVRKALFDGASDSGDPEKRERLGRGELKVMTALEQQPAAAGMLEQEEPDSASFALLRNLTGLGNAAADARQRMLELEALQLSQSAAMEGLLPDPDSLSESAAQRQRIAEALATHPNASQALREALKDHVAREPRPVAPKLVTSNLIQKLHLEKATAPKPPKPTYRRLRVYAYDPSLSTKLETLGINEAILNVQWEDNLQPGPVGEYLEVVDVDPASQCAYAPVDLNDPYLLVQDGIPPSEANPRFHQQMVYAVAMKTIEYFERALGRRALWSPRRLTDAQGNIDDRFVQRLRIYPHGSRAANAYYSPDRKALLFGYFAASESANGEVLPGGLVFSALSHDIIAHETTHALLDGLHRRFREPTNRDVFAFHEAFADIVALFQHFTIPEALRQQIARTRGDLQRENLLAQLAVEFGQATRGHGALRDAIGRFENGKWEPQPPLSRAKFNELDEPHDRGAVLVAAVFDAFLRIYRGHVTELIRLATAGTGVLPEGDIPDALVDQLARKAAAVASQVLTICIRALDYAPPTDITFGDYLRALITADRDLVPDDKRTYRVAFISAFRDRGIFPAEVKTLSVGSLAWEPPPIPLKNIRTVLEKMSLSWDLNTDRRRAYDVSLGNARKMHAWLMNPEQVTDAEVAALGLFRGVDKKEIGTMTAKLSGIEVHSVRPARRVAPDGRARADLVIEITQRLQLEPPRSGRFRGGCTLLVDLEENEVRYFVRKRVDSAARVEAQLTFQQSLRDELRDTYFAGSLQEAEPFAMLHRRH